MKFKIPSWCKKGEEKSGFILKNALHIGRDTLEWKDHVVNEEMWGIRTIENEEHSQWEKWWKKKKLIDKDPYIKNRK